ncbi:excalibur calcium-binding domain-containing protein [Priestia aryabhattai]|uniref:excalibur calcium-binding domain-containing protein n=1 Tax=Priestia aryabhattai TaxID=412384 RepID=UPI0037358A57
MVIAVIGVLLFFAFVICLIWGIVNLVRKKKAKKVFLISLASLVLCFVLALVDSSNDEEQAAEKEAQMQKEREARIEKKPAKTASAEVEKPIFSFVEASAIVLKMKEKDVDDDINRYDFIKTSVMKGYLATKMKDHVYTFADVDKSGEWTRVTFSDDNKKVIKVEMSPDLEKKAIAFNNKEADKEKEKAAETAKKEEAQKKADEQKKQEEQKAKEEAQAKAAEEKRKQEEAARVAEEKRVAEQKQKEQEALQAKQQAEAEQARKEAEEKAQAEAEAQAQQQQQQTQTASFANCTEVRAAGRAPIRQGEPGFEPKFDRDGDGIGCDQ